jgi:hypothetical protein
MPHALTFSFVPDISGHRESRDVFNGRLAFYAKYESRRIRITSLSARHRMTLTRCLFSHRKFKFLVVSHLSTSGNGGSLS